MLLKVSAKPLQICSKQKVQIEQVNQLSDSAVLEKKQLFFSVGFKKSKAMQEARLGLFAFKS